MKMSFLNEMPIFVPQEVCLACDGCCRFRESGVCWRPRLSAEDAAGLNSRDNALLEQNSDAGMSVKTVFIPNSGIVRCAFFCIDDNKCRVYPNRPFECRLYPFLLCRRNDGIVIGVHLGCPYVQDNMGTDSFNAYVSSLRQYLNSREVEGFIRDNMFLVRDYSSVEGEVSYLN